VAFPQRSCRCICKRKIDGEEARENLTTEYCDHVEWYEDKEPEGKGLPSTM